MPKRTDISTILIIGAGPIVIGQACEFDYSGTQACKALKEEGYRIILVNSNPATIMTDPDLADATYIEPITPEVVAKIIARSAPSAPTKSWCCCRPWAARPRSTPRCRLKRMGVLERYDVEMIGAKPEAIDKAEDRELFREAMARIGLETPRSFLVNATEIKDADRKEYESERARLRGRAQGDELDAALDALKNTWNAGRIRPQAALHDHAMAGRQALDEIGLPAIIRPSFTLGGTGGGIAYNRSKSSSTSSSAALDASPTTEVLIEESVLGWKEYEMEVVRDKADNCIIICSIENLDPMGVHTGDSITVAPALTLTDKEYQIMRNASIAVLREIGVETGGSNVQFAVNPEDGRLVVIEMNPRVSRSSALASKATGFPIAKVAAKLAVGYTLDELENDITGGATPASFEPTIDYVVTKIPRFAFEKFPGAEPTADHRDEVGRRGHGHRPHLPKACKRRCADWKPALTGLNEIEIPGLGEGDDKNAIRAAIGTPTPDRLLMVAQACASACSNEEVHAAARSIPGSSNRSRPDHRHGSASASTACRRTPKTCGCSSPWAFPMPGWRSLTGKRPRSRKARRELGVHRSTSASTPAPPNSPRPPPTCTRPTRPRSPARRQRGPTVRPQKVVILGGGPNRIGQGIEFDYCCCHAAFALADAGYETIMVNCNPETVSTDYDTSDRLYFEPLTAEDVLEILTKEQENGTLLGVIVQFGGQTPLKLAEALEKAGIPILGTSPDMPSTLPRTATGSRSCCKKLDLAAATTASPIRSNRPQDRRKIGFPLVVRPSYVLGGRAMQIIRDEEGLDSLPARHRAGTGPVKARYPNDKTGQINTLLGTNPLLFDSYLTDAIEVDVDACATAPTCSSAGIMEHIEEAGIHSGDSACSLPVHTLSRPTCSTELERQTAALARALNVGGLMNVQYAIKDGDIYVLEVNPRASRTVPFVAKTVGAPIAKIAARVMAGEKLADPSVPMASARHRKLNHIAVKEAVFPFARFPGVDTPCSGRKCAPPARSWGFAPHRQ
jgi:carbamoyl-phosphate synthase large subunit